MHDVTLTKSGALAHVQGETDAGVEFVDAVTVPLLAALDSGRITIPDSSVDELVREARQQGLTVYIEAL